MNAAVSISVLVGLVTYAAFFVFGATHWIRGVTGRIYAKCSVCDNKGCTRGVDVLMIARYLLRQNQTERSLRFSADAVEALEQYEWPGNISEAARLLGVSRPTLYNLSDKYDIELNDGDKV